MEIIVADGGSSDGTLKIARKYESQIVNNPLKTGEAGKAIGLKEAKDLVDGAPKPIKEGVNKEDAAEIKKKLEAAGATVELK